MAIANDVPTVITITIPDSATLARVYSALAPPASAAQSVQAAPGTSTADPVGGSPAGPSADQVKATLIAYITQRVMASEAQQARLAALASIGPLPAPPVLS
jgi:hypothetical protein